MSKWTTAQVSIVCLLILAVLISDLLLENVFVIKTVGGQVLSQGYFICVITIVFLALHFFCYCELQKEKNIFQRSFISYIGKISFALFVLFIIGSMTVFVSLPVFQVISDFRLIAYLFIFIGLALLYFTLFGFVRALITDRHSSEIMTIKITTIALWEAVRFFETLAPFGHGFAKPLFSAVIAKSDTRRVFYMGADKQHVKLVLTNGLTVIHWNGASVFKGWGEKDTDDDAVFAVTGELGVNTFNNH